MQYTSTTPTTSINFPPLCTDCWKVLRRSAKALLTGEGFFFSNLTGGFLGHIFPISKIFQEEAGLGCSQAFFAFSLPLECGQWVEKEPVGRVKSQRSLSPLGSFCPSLDSPSCPLSPPTPTSWYLDCCWQFSVRGIRLPWQCYPAHCLLSHLLSISSFLSAGCWLPHILFFFHTYPNTSL